jgi:4'-phosphopantetheinyl transferase
MFKGWAGSPLGWDGRWCQVWTADISWLRPEHDAMLDLVERTRAARYVRESDRSRFVLGAVLLKSVVAQEEGVVPSEVQVDRRCATCREAHGAPRIVASDLNVSVSHSGSRVVVAITPVGPVGVDVELRTARLVMPPSRRVLAPSEPMLEARDFFTYWCRKESVLKAMGVGLASIMSEVIVSPTHEPARLVSYKGGNVSASMVDVTIDDEYAAAVTVLTDDAVSWRGASAENLIRSVLLPV